jgi:hypothetical protein
MPPEEPVLNTQGTRARRLFNHEIPGMGFNQARHDSGAPIRVVGFAKCGRERRGRERIQG